jgi:hypothetical protein
MCIIPAHGGGKRFGQWARTQTEMTKVTANAPKEKAGQLAGPPSQPEDSRQSAAVTVSPSASEAAGVGIGTNGKEASMPQLTASSGRRLTCVHPRVGTCPGLFFLGHRWWCRPFTVLPITVSVCGGLRMFQTRHVFGPLGLHRRRNRLGRLAFLLGWSSTVPRRQLATSSHVRHREVSCFRVSVLMTLGVFALAGSGAFSSHPQPGEFCECPPCARIYAVRFQRSDRSVSRSGVKMRHQEELEGRDPCSCRAATDRESAPSP